MNLENQNTLHKQLKEQTSELHEKAHNVLYISNLLKNEISIISYTGHLRILAIIYGTLENQIIKLENKNIKQFFENYIPKLPLLILDLEFLKTFVQKDIISAVNNALHIVDKILINSLTNPYKLLGYIYTLEGSLNGGNLLKKHIIETFNFENNDATKYFSCFDDKFKFFWNDFIQKLDSNIIEKNHKEDILAASSEIFYDLIKIYENLFPFDENSLKNHITSLNPEAGNYPISTNPDEINAALIAGLNCWNEFPYLEKRFGERGRRFTVSDSVWLVNLSELSEDIAIKQVNWLANFLAIRGMSTIIIEFQLQLLYNELIKILPLNNQKYLNLLKATENLKDKRNKNNDNIFENANFIFEKYFNQFKIDEQYCCDLKKNIGKLIASSIIDNKNGIPDAKNSLKNWLQNKEIFSENWVLAIEKTYFEIEFNYNKM